MIRFAFTVLVLLGAGGIASAGHCGGGCGSGGGRGHLFSFFHRGGGCSSGQCGNAGVGRRVVTSGNMSMQSSGGCPSCPSASGTPMRAAPAAGCPGGACPAK